MNTSTLIRSLCALGAAATISTSAEAITVNPNSYDMLNGNLGRYRYYDELYTGIGATGDPNTQASPLAGGLGKLTDGYIATNRFDLNERFNIDPLVDGAYGQYVGWRAYDSEFAVETPTITFHFDPGTIINTVTIWVDDADGVGNVDQPDSVTINGDTFAFIDPTPTPDAGNPEMCKDDNCVAKDFAFINTMPFSNAFEGEWTGTELTLEFAYLGEWIMLSEIQFGYTPPPAPAPTPTVEPTPTPTTTAIAEPGTLAMFGLGLAGLGFARRRKASK